MPTPHPIGIHRRELLQVGYSGLLGVGLGGLLPRAARAAWLAEAWVCKEATLKALGVGLAVDPRTVELERRKASVSGGVGEFRVAGYPGLKGWLYRSGESSVALAASTSGVQMRRLHVTLDAPGVESRSARIQQRVVVPAGSAS